MPAHPRRRSFESSGLARVLVLAVVTVVAAASCVPLVSAATSGRQYGRGPIDAVWEAAAAHTKCAGLTSAELAAMMMVPTYPETGGAVPSPMTLGRWDNVSVWSRNANLFAFGQTSGPYTGAFFSAGVGMWQFDSAGGWPLSAASAIDAVTSAKQAASTIAFRYCNPPSSVARDDASLRRYAWGPWYGCGTSGAYDCEAAYDDLYDSELLNTSVDDTVGRFGGMEQRTCDVAGLGAGLVCWYVDPARAQGSTGWRAGTYDPARTDWVTPLPKPFYVVEANGREYRVWLQADTGFDTGITVHKPVTANARTSLLWERSALLCDRTASRGTCAPLPTSPPPPPGGTAYTYLLRDSNSQGIADRSVSFGTVRPAQPLMCDWDGDGVSTPGAFAGGGWTISDRSDGADPRSFVYGNSQGDIAACGDWDGNGSETPAVLRGTTWFISNRVETAVADHLIGYGNPGDVGVVGDWNGDRVDSIGVFRNGYWFLTDDIYNGRASTVFGFGNSSGDVPVVGDWDGNGRDETAVFRSGWWFLATSAGQPTASTVFGYGDPTDWPVAGRWGSAGRDTPGVVR